MKGAPHVTIFVPLEGKARALLVCESSEDEERLALNLNARDLLAELAEVLRELADVLDGEAAT